MALTVNNFFSSFHSSQSKKNRRSAR